MKLPIAALALFLSLSPAFADEPPGAEKQPDARVLFGMWPDDGACTPDNTKKVALKNLLRDLPRYRDECISTVGFLQDRALFVRREDTRLKYPSSNEASASRRIGLYGNEQVMEEIWGDNGARVRIIGMLWDCEIFNGPDVIMVMVYCHYTGGPIIGAASVHRER